MGVKNVLILNDFGQINGGASKIAFTEMLALKQRGMNVIFLCGVGPVDTIVEKAGIECYCLNQKDILTGSKMVGFFRGLWNSKARKTLYGILSKYSTSDTVVHIHGWSKCLSASILNVADNLGFKSFVTLHDFFLYCPNGGLLNYKTNRICELTPMSAKCLACNCDSRSILQKYWRYVRQILQDDILRHTSHVSYISISKLTQNLFLKFRPTLTDKLFRIDNPIDLPAYKDDVHNSSGDRYLFVGRLSEEKGIRLFLEAVTQAHVKAEIWGDGYLMEELSQKYPEVIFRGWVDDSQKRTYLSSIKALVFPSVWYETFGLVVAEMLSMGIPCIVGDRTAASELIKDGHNGILYKIGNLASLKNAISQMEKLSSSMNARDYFDKEEYSVQKHVERLIKLYNI